MSSVTVVVKIDDPASDTIEVITGPGTPETTPGTTITGVIWTRKSVVDEDSVEAIPLPVAVHR